MQTFYILLHEVGGSRYEATYPQHIFGPFTEAEAEMKHSLIESTINRYLNDNWIANIFDPSKSKTNIQNFLDYIKDEN